MAKLTRLTLTLTPEERDVLILLIESGCALDGPVRLDLRPTLVLGVLPKLRRLKGAPRS